LHEAIQKYLKANEINPSSTSEYVHLVQALAMSHVTDDALYVAEAGLKVAISPSIERLELLINYAIICWLSGKYDQAKDAIVQSNFALLPAFNKSPNIHSLRAFYGYLEKLLQIRSESAAIYEGEAGQAMFFVGDSHCLSPSETILQFQGQSYRVLSTLIKGCKAWHLGRSESNQFKRSIELLFKALPPGSKIIVGMGEIDCRVDEGILPAFLKKGLDFHMTIPQLVYAYVRFMTTLANQYNHSLIFYGVPALSQELGVTLEPEKVSLLSEIIDIFNDELRHTCQKSGWKILDVYGATINNNMFHIDKYHLHPKTLGMVFQSHLLT
jgi:tetratricopeptide (TPR) repeat protein